MILTVSYSFLIYLCVDSASEECLVVFVLDIVRAREVLIIAQTDDELAHGHLLFDWELSKSSNPRNP